MNENKPWLSILDGLNRNQELVEKYNHPGIYSVSIGDKLAYIGKSRDMICRLAQHIFYTNNLQETKTHKYKIFALARLMGYDVRFDVMYVASGKSEAEIDDEIGKKEAELINQYLPPLNYQIPKMLNYKSFTVNKRANTITLLELLGNSEKMDLLKIQKSQEDGK